MPVEIRELVIRARAVEQTTVSRSSGISSEAVREEGAQSISQEDLIDACVRKVLDVLAARQER